MNPEALRILVGILKVLIRSRHRSKAEVEKLEEELRKFSEAAVK